MFIQTTIDSIKGFQGRLEYVFSILEIEHTYYTLVLARINQMRTGWCECCCSVEANTNQSKTQMEKGEK